MIDLIFCFTDSEIDFQSQLDRYSFYCRIGPVMSQILLIFQIPN